MKFHPLRYFLLTRKLAYDVGAYEFVLEAVEYTVSKLSVKRHISGKELVFGIKELAHERFGYLAWFVFSQWNVRETIDIGKIVFELVNLKLLGKTPRDSLKDFENVYDLEKVLKEEYEIPIK